ncbi:65-kDa microtubule-associated protein 8 [Hibiscus syriacus]|uniref:65-kDa microtubule-associated protein 8 n=1 Tax=Hibiscus syriacus TaxID=106335 RepID=A0A6A3BJX6_HIBSY|nr:65-kDa microtubule-associated protein 8 [Hibiscus syriacus]
MGSLQAPPGTRSSALLETSCGYLLQELQARDFGEDQSEREKVLLELEQECLEVYRRKVDRANMSRAIPNQELAESEAEFTHLLLSLDERSLPGRKISGTIKQQLDSITPPLRDMRLRKEERVNQFRAVQGKSRKSQPKMLLHQLGKALKNLWSLIDTSYGDHYLFSHVIGLLSVSSAEVSDPGSLTLDIIQQAEAEVKRLDQLKASKMKELFLKKQNELEDICNKSHMEIPSRSEMENILNLINTGIDHVELLMSIDEQISKAKEEASSRKSIMEKWILAREEKHWLEEYSMANDLTTIFLHN